MAAEAEQVERTRRKTCSRGRSEVFVPYTLPLPGDHGDLVAKDLNLEVPFAVGASASSEQPIIRLRNQ